MLKSNLYRKQIEQKEDFSREYFYCLAGYSKNVAEKQG